MNTNWRESSLEFGRVNTVWLGELMLVYAPVAIVGLMVLATMSFVLGDGIATNPRFELAWAWASALSVDGVMLALIVRAAKPEKSWRYGVTLATLAPMILVGVALLALVTMQQTLQITSEQLAIHMLGVDPVVLVIGRAVLTMFAALVGLVFSHLRTEPSEPNRTVSEPVNRTKRTRVNQIAVQAVPNEPVLIPEHATNRTEPSQYELVKAYYEPNRTYAEISELSGVHISSVKRHVPQIKRELATA